MWPGRKCHTSARHFWDFANKIFLFSRGVNFNGICKPNVLFNLFCFFQIWSVKYSEISVCGPLVGYLKEVALIKGNSAEFTLLMVHRHRATPDRDLKRLKVDAWSVMSRECGLEVGNKGGEVGTVGFQLCSIFKHRASTRFVRIHPRWEARSRGGQQLESGSFVNIYMEFL